MAGPPALSAWEVAELVHYHAHGWTVQELAWHYGVCERTVQRILRRAADALRADSRPAVAQNE